MDKLQKEKLKNILKDGAVLGIWITLFSIFWVAGYIFIGSILIAVMHTPQWIEWVSQFTHIPSFSLSLITGAFLTLIVLPGSMSYFLIIAFESTIRDIYNTFKNQKKEKSKWGFSG